MAQQTGSSSFDKLVAYAGFDPVKKPSLTDDILKEALREIQEAKKKEALEKARELVKKAVELREQVLKAEQEFNKQRKKFEDELGKIIGQLRLGVDQATQAVQEQPAEQPAEKTE